MEEEKEEEELGVHPLSHALLSLSRHFFLFVVHVRCGGACNSCTAMQISLVGRTGNSESLIPLKLLTTHVCDRTRRNCRQTSAQFPTRRARDLLVGQRQLSSVLTRQQVTRTCWWDRELRAGAGLEILTRSSPPNQAKLQTLVDEKKQRRSPPSTPRSEPLSGAPSLCSRARIICICIYIYV